MRISRKKSEVCHRIECAKCGKTDFVSFVPDGSRKYYCNDCLSEFNLQNKAGKVKVINDSVKGGDVFSFICDSCNTLKKTRRAPLKIEGKLLCSDCAEKEKIQKRRSKRKNIKIAQ